MRNRGGPSWWAIAGLAALTLGGITFAGHVANIATVFADYGHGLFEDWQNASNAADRLLVGEPLYHADQLRGPYRGPDYTLNGLAYPPPSAVIFVLFRGEPVGLILWLVLNVGLLATGLGAILRAELGPLAGRAMAFVVAGLLAFPPFAVGVMWANLNVGLAGLFAWCWVDRSRWTAAGAGIGGLLKVYPMGMAAWRIRVDGWRRPLGWAVITAVGIAALTLPLVGKEAWFDFAAAFANTRPVCLTESSSVVCLLDGPLGAAGARTVATLAAVMLVVASVTVRHKGWAYALLAAGMMAAVLDLHYHYWIFAFVAGTAVISNVMGQRISRRAERALQAAGGVSDTPSAQA